MVTKKFINQLLQKLKVGNLRSTHLNALPGNRAARLDASDLDVAKEGSANEFIDQLLSEPSFSQDMSFENINLNKADEELRKHIARIGKRLDNMSYESKDNFLEHGISNFGFGFPLLVKRSKNDPDRIIKAPLLIWHLDIEKSSRKKQHWTVTRQEDDSISINEMLISYLAADENISIAGLSREFLEDGIIDKDELLTICKKILEQLNETDDLESLQIKIEKCPDSKSVSDITSSRPWICWSGVFGIYRAQKESIIRNTEEILEGFDEFEFDDLKAESYQTSSISGVPTDPSQEEIVNSITASQSKIIQGPPGTGKSQSLTAIITNALENNARCLVVCEKKTALDVIYNNLAQLGLESLCAVIDDVNRDRKTVISKVRESFEQKRSSYFRQHDYDQKLKRFEKLKLEINQHHGAVLSKVFGDDYWKDVIGRFLAKEKIHSKDDLKKSVKSGDFKFDREEFARLSRIVEDSKEFFAEIETLDHPLEKLNKQLFGLRYSQKLKESVEKDFIRLEKLSVQIVKKIKSDVKNYNEQFFSKSLKNNLLINGFAWASKKYSAIKTEQEQVNKNLLELQNIHNKKDYFGFVFPSNFSDYRMAGSEIAKYNELLKGLIKCLPVFRVFFEWKSFRLSLESKEQRLIAAIIKTKNDDWVATLESWYFDNVLSKHEKDFSPFLRNDKLLQELIQVNHELQTLQKDKILSIWNGNSGDALYKFGTRGNAKTLYNLARNKKYGRRNSLRKIIDIDFDLFTSTFPVILINPVACGSIIPMKEGIFDLVIFDEASQLRLEDTYPALLRGKYRVISGDRHQMPPSSYFQVTADNDLDEKDEDDMDINNDENKNIDDTQELVDSESLLKFAENSKGVTTSFLDFHYRSRHPALVEFSNAAFYGSRLVPMPEKTAYKPIHFIAVNGMYEDGTNPAEAQKVIEILKTEIQPHKNGEMPSVGVATMNLKQRNLIIDMINEEIYKDRKFGVKYHQLLESGLFIKNLENIQGDERDIMIMSTTFGLNAHGKFRQNFGPINQTRGYKLLNVIITRAKHNFYICTSIPKEKYSHFREEIQAKGNSGKAIFYAYLAYAEAVSNEDQKAKESILELLQERCEEKPIQQDYSFVESPFEQEVYEYLSEHIDPDLIVPQYKIGGFRIDFVILDAKTKKPVIAIECDGAKYHSGNEAYAYDMFREKQITDMGFKVYRIWSTNWWEDPISETKQLVDFIKNHK